MMLITILYGVIVVMKKHCFIQLIELIIVYQIQTQSFISVAYLCMNNKMQPFLTAFYK